LIDEAQEMSPHVLNELWLTASARFDSQPLFFVWCSPGDTRPTDKLMRDELLPLGSRIRSRLATKKVSAGDLLACLEHLLTTLANELLTTDEKLHFEVFAPSRLSSRRTPARQPNAAR
jgi:general secretion pathway protein A